ncbi:hypothetical protein [Streptosporangium sp. NPDC002524]|uniref:hypothetical protein n=1 Tax=Streptosporangium sp. NPDC002524 TaxID=3154537 RepID=UPI0033259DB5
MYARIEALGSSLLSRFVPKTDAQACGWYSWSACWQCAGSACSVNTCNGELRCR